MTEHVGTLSTTQQRGDRAGNVNGNRSRTGRPIPGHAEIDIPVGRDPADRQEAPEAVVRCHHDAANGGIGKRVAPETDYHLVGQVLDGRGNRAAVVDQQLPVRGLNWLR